ncbi:patatin-like protein 2 [Elaeis guineensis]|uniref:patatin-like protein 2 n=1 Tax=Elaeis guineensis var. tenera TaxID=51953 RepID=UPI003C6D62F1
MLTAPDDDNRPLFAAKDIESFYKVQSPKIFPQYGGILAPITRMVRALWGPRYNGNYLHKLIRENLGSMRLDQTLTNVVIPTFDVKRLHPTIFSSYEVNLETGVFEPVGNGEGTNEDALRRFAKLLSQERGLRESRSPHVKMPIKY